MRALKSHAFLPLTSCIRTWSFWVLDLNCNFSMLLRALRRWEFSTSHSMSPTLVASLRLWLPNPCQCKGANLCGAIDVGEILL